MTHMIVLFIVVLVLFGPQKLPELARGFGKLMAEFRKASTDFKSAFEQEMRDIERQALQAERKKAAEAAAASAAAMQQQTEPAALPPVSTAPASLDADAPVTEAHVTEALVVTPVAESIPRSDGAAAQPANGNSAGAVGEPSQALSHDQEQPV